MKLWQKYCYKVVCVLEYMYNKYSGLEINQEKKYMVIGSTKQTEDCLVIGTNTGNK